MLDASGIEQAGGVLMGAGMGADGMSLEDQKKMMKLKILGGMLMNQQPGATKSNGAYMADILAKGVGGYLAGGGKFNFGSSTPANSAMPTDAGVSTPASYGANGMDGLA